MLQVNRLAKSFADRTLFKQISFTIAPGDKVGLIAPNGTGKTTLLRIIAGEEAPDTGEVISSEGLRLAYLSQTLRYNAEDTILSICYGDSPTARLAAEWHTAGLANDSDALERLLPKMEALGAWDYERRAEEILHKLSITDLSQPLSQLSGGELKRVALAGVLLAEPDLIILDEPTNHLDLDAIEWLEEYLSRSKLMLLMVTHDRYFLESVCHTILELTSEGCYRYPGSYSYYLQKREERIAQQAQEMARERNLYRRELDWMRRQPQARGGKQKARQQAFDKLEASVTRKTEIDELKLEAGDLYLGNKIIEMRNLSFAYPNGPTLIKGLDYSFARYDRVGIVGPNGAGKSTLIKLMLGELSPTAGSLKVGETIRFGHFSQQGPNFAPGKRVIEVLTDIADQVQLPEGGRPISAAQMLARFLFPPERQYTPVEKLSGGELKRLYLCTVLIKQPNFLILDEPTNDLDLLTLSALEEYLVKFKGCLVVVTHDRFFLDRIVEHLFVFQPDGSIKDFPGSYREWCDSKREALDEKREDVTEKLTNPKTEKPKRAQTRRTFAEERTWRELGERIAHLESEHAILCESMSSGQLAGDELLLQARRSESIMQELEEITMKWLELDELSPN